LSTKISRLACIREELLEDFGKFPLEIVKFSALMKAAASKIEVDEGKRGETTLLLARGIVDPKTHAQVLPIILELMEEKSVQTEALNHYVRCLFAKALSSIFGKTVVRYRNEAARKIYFENLSSLSQIVLPISMEEQITKLRLIETKNSQLYDGFFTELKNLLKIKWQPQNDFEIKLQQSDIELVAAVKAMEKLSGVEGGKTGYYREDLGICSFFDPWTTDDSETTYWGTRHYPILNLLNIDPPILFFDQLRRGLIARDIAHMFTPMIMKRMERSYEQNDYCAYKILQNPFESEFWKMARHGLREDSRRFEGIDYFEEWNAITGGDFVRKIYSRLESISRFRSQIDLSEYETIADSLALKPKRVKLDVLDLKVLDLMARDALASVSQMAQKTGLSLPTVQKIVRDLEKKANLWPFVVVDTSKFGVTGFLLMVETRTGFTREVAEEIWKVPYCGRVYRIYGRCDLLAYFNIPTGNETFIHEFGNQLKKEGIAKDFVWYRITDFHYGLNPRYYSAAMGEWNVYWDEWGLWLKEYLSSRGWNKAFHYESNDAKVQVKINKLDLQIINMLRMNARCAFADIGHRIGVSGAYVGQRVRRLLNQDVIRPKIATYRIGLDDSVWVVLDCDDDTSRSLVSAFNELPMWQGFSVKGDMIGLASIMYIPTGEVQELLRVFDRYLIESRLVNDYEFHIVEKWTGMRRGVPIHLYSNEKGWLFQRDAYLEDLKKDIASMDL